MRNAIRVTTAVALLLATAVLTGCRKEPAVAPQTGPEIAQTTCPVMGGAIDKNIYVDHNGRRIYFCCEACVEQFKKEPEKYIKKLDDELQAVPRHGGGTHKAPPAPEDHKRP